MAELKKDGHKKEAKTSDVDDHIANRYDIKKRLGKGAYGIVWKAVDYQTKDVVAVKKIFEAFRNQTDAQRTFREIMFLQAFKGHPNIITLRGLHKASNNKDIYLIFDFMDTDLHHVIKRGTVLKDVHKRYIMYQLFRATQYLHSGNVIHRDQKPSNVLINTECKIKIADFGLARSLSHSVEDEDEGILTDYVATRWYRAPEILVASKRYTKGVDMWSLGCILGEMLLGKPLFPGSSTVNQMERVLAVLPQPTAQEIYSMCSGYGKGLLDSYTGPKTSLKEMVNTPCDEAMDLLQRLLVFDPARRLTAASALRHPYVSRYCQGREVILDKDVTPPLNDDIQLSVADYRNKLYEMIESARVKRKQIIKSQQSFEEKTGSPEGAEEWTKQYKSSSRSKYNDSQLSKDTMHRVNQVESKVSNVDLRPLEGSLRRSSHYINGEESKERRIPREHNGNKVATTISEYSQKLVNQRKTVGSPSHKGMGPQRSVSYWPDRQRTLTVKHSKIRHQENGSGDGPPIRMSSAQPPISEAMAQVKEKLMRRTQAINTPLGTLPKVSHKKEISQHNGSSPSHVSRYIRHQGVLSTSALQEIRNVLKH